MLLITAVITNGIFILAFMFYGITVLCILGTIPNMITMIFMLFVTGLLAGNVYDLILVPRHLIFGNWVTAWPYISILNAVLAIPPIIEVITAPIIVVSTSFDIDVMAYLMYILSGLFIGQ